MILIATVKATVSRVEPKGVHGPYAVAYDPSEHYTGSITFSLDPPVWTEFKHPEGGSVVILEEIEPKTKGWRAHKARFMAPEDEVE